MEIRKIIGKVIEYKSNTKRLRVRPRHRWKDRGVKELEELRIVNNWQRKEIDQDK